jgi:hypothetical protein
VGADETAPADADRAKDATSFSVIEPRAASVGIIVNAPATEPSDVIGKATASGCVKPNSARNSQPQCEASAGAAARLRTPGLDTQAPDPAGRTSPA